MRLPPPLPLLLFSLPLTLLYSHRCCMRCSPGCSWPPLRCTSTQVHPPPSLPFPIRVPLPYPSSTRVASFRRPWAVHAPRQRDYPRQPRGMRAPRYPPPPPYCCPYPCPYCTLPLLTTAPPIRRKRGAQAAPEQRAANNPRLRPCRASPPLWGRGFRAQHRGLRAQVNRYNMVRDDPFCPEADPPPPPPLPPYCCPYPCPYCTLPLLTTAKPLSRPPPSGRTKAGAPSLRGAARMTRKGAGERVGVQRDL